MSVGSTDSTQLCPSHSQHPGACCATTLRFIPHAAGMRSLTPARNTDATASFFPAQTSPFPSEPDDVVSKTGNHKTDITLTKYFLKTVSASSCTSFFFHLFPFFKSFSLQIQKEAVSRLYLCQSSNCFARDSISVILLSFIVERIVTV